jgi:hypothetical protein
MAAEFDLNSVIFKNVMEKISSSEDVKYNNSSNVNQHECP